MDAQIQAAPPAQAAPGPITAEERITFIDVLRGFALFGVLTANMRAFNAPAVLYSDIGKLFHSRVDVWAQGAIDALISGKFITLFSFLFGLGFAVMFDRISARGARFTRIYPRRLAVLALMGLIHGALIWWGDILLIYAITGFLLFCFHKAKQKTVLRWAGGIYLAGILTAVGFYVASRLGRHTHMFDQPKIDMKKVQQSIAIYSHGGLRTVVHQNFLDWKQMLPPELFSIIYVLCIFLLGLYVWRSGIVQNLTANRDLLARVCRITLPAGLLLNILATVAGHYVPDPNAFTFETLMLGIMGATALPMLSCGYATALALLYLDPTWRTRLAPLAALGRMALTNYLTESVVCMAFYTGIVTGLYGRVGPALGLVFTLVLYAVQVLFSMLWFKHFRFGPTEWVWRGLTYGHFPSIRHAEPEMARAAAQG